MSGRDDRHKLAKALFDEVTQKIQQDAKDAAEVVEAEWPKGDVDVLVLIVHRTRTGGEFPGGWYSNFMNRERLLEALESVGKNSRTMQIGSSAPEQLEKKK